jgi:catechol 2,3-dioxygenase-like lactoylglutathione lyase family enzyme
MSAQKQRVKPTVTFQSNKDVAIHVSDLKRAEQFYAGVLGLRVIARSDSQLHLDAGSFNLWVNVADAARSFIPSFDVPDYEAAERHLVAAGCKKIQSSTEGGYAYFQDPFGFTFDIIAR